METKDFFKFWNKIQLSILHMASTLSEEDLDVTFDSALRPIGETFNHIAAVYNGWLTYQIVDGEENPEPIAKESLTVANINDALKNAFDRCNRLIDRSSDKDWDKILIDYDSKGIHTMLLLVGSYGISENMISRSVEVTI